MIEAIVWLLMVFLTVFVIMTHFGTLVFVSDRIIPWAQRKGFSRGAIAWAVGGLLVGHLLEIVIFAVGLAVAPDGAIGDLSAYLRLSAANYTTVGATLPQAGYGVVVLSAIEPAVGLMMFIWSASFALLKMQSIWERRRARRD